MIRLLDACVQSLRAQGMRKMFLDAIKGGYEGFQSIGMSHNTFFFPRIREVLLTNRS